MDEAELNEAWEAITQIEAQEMLVAMKASAYPHMGKNAEKLLKEVHKSAYPQADKKKRAIKLEDVADFLSGRK